MGQVADTIAQRQGRPMPDKQLWFNKQTTCINGPYDPIVRGVTEKLDYEVELGVVIGRAAKASKGREGRRRSVFGPVRQM